MKLRYPAVPLVTHTPYFNLWSMDDVPNRTPTCHWTGASQPLCGLLQVGKREYGFLGKTDALPMRMRSVEVKACSTTYVMESPEAALTVKFTSPLLLDDLKVLARPVTYVSLKAQGRYGRPLPPCWRMRPSAWTTPASAPWSPARPWGRAMRPSPSAAVSSSL